MKNYFFYPLLICLICLTFFGDACRMPAGNGLKSGIEVSDADGKTVIIADNSRIVAIGTSVTETVYALNAGEKLVGVDSSSSEYLPQSANLPKVGPRTTLSAEGILSLKPTLVILTADSGPPPVIEQLRNAGIAVLTLTSDYTVETVKAKVKTISRALGSETKGTEIADSIDREMIEAVKLTAKIQDKPKVMFVGRGPNMPNATMSGSGTTIDEMIKLGGGVNPNTEFKGFREMTDEAVVAAQPDVILMTEKSFARSGGIDGVLTFPGVKLTPAGKNRRIVTVSDMYFQGFGPGVGKAVRELIAKLHPELAADETKK